MYCLSFHAVSTPDGLLSFVCEGFPGRHNDVTLVKESGLLELFRENGKCVDTCMYVHHAILLDPSCV